MEELERLQRWYAARCNGEWEHHQGLTLQSCDNPGWWLKVDLRGTPLLGRPFQEIRQGVGPDSHPNQPVWLQCRVLDGVFHGAGDPFQLREILRVFLDWAGA